VPEQCQYCDKYKRPRCPETDRFVRRKQKAKVLGLDVIRRPVTCFTGDKKKPVMASERKRRTVGMNTIRRRMNSTRFKN
jgi:hypothetical protein